MSTSTHSYRPVGAVSLPRAWTACRCCNLPPGSSNSVAHSLTCERCFHIYFHVFFIFLIGYRLLPSFCLSVFSFWGTALAATFILPLHVQRPGQPLHSCLSVNMHGMRQTPGHNMSFKSARPSFY